MRIVLIILVLLLLMAAITRISPGESIREMPMSMLALGFTLIVAYLIGKMTSALGIPKITGYILAGILTGPYIINLLSKPTVQNLQLIDNMALSLIALTAGGEFRYRAIRKQFKTIGSVIFWKILLVIIGFILFIFVYKTHIQFLSNQSHGVVLGAALLFGALSIATSPATTIAIISETRAKGKFTDFVLGVTVFKDVIVVLVFSLALSVAKPLILPETHIQFSYFISVLLEIMLSIVIGIATGAVILVYLKYVKEQKALFLLGFIIFIIELSNFIHLEVILVFMVAGFFVQNFSQLGHHLIDAIEDSALPIFVVFFAIAGASLNFNILMQNWLLAIIIVILRLFTTYSGTYIGAELTSGDNNIKKYGWMGFIGQAGLSLGLSVLLMKKIPGPITKNIATLIVASIAINQIIGPILFRYSIIKVGEGK
jgi:Kef-type K+ transport system membrane component KefB